MNNENKVAVIGMSGVFPDAADMDEFFRNLCDGKDAVRRISKERLRHSSLSPLKKHKLMATLDRIDYFDHKLFGISRKDADYIDPTQRLLLQLSYSAIENAGYNIDDFNGSNTAILLGGKNESGWYYYQLIKDHEEPGVFTGTLGSMSYARVAYFLNTKGPAMLIDTACSSALVAIHNGFEKLINNEVDYVLAGALTVNIQFPLITSKGYLGSHAPDGRCKAFDAAADGIGTGEGGGLLLLKRLDKALADRDVIHAVILGSAINQDGGRSNGITAPSPEAQTEVIKSAWKKAAVEPETISYIETHGTGTKLGDPIEFRGITDAFNEFSDRRKFCAIGSVKTNIGHLGAAAGAAGMIKAILSLKNRLLFPSIHFSQPNPFIDFENSAAYVNTTCKDWTTQGSRRCGVSAFGLSGTNAHIVLEEGKGSAALSYIDTLSPFVLKLSVFSAALMQEYAASVHKYLGKETLSLPDALYTLNTGRKEYAFRRAFLANSRQQLLEQLEAFMTAPLPSEFLKNRHAVLFLSPITFDSDRTRFLCEHFKVFQQQFDLISGFEVAGDMEERRSEFAFSYAMYHTFKAMGIYIRTVIGAGICKHITRLINGQSDISSSLIAYCSESAGDLPVEKDKLTALVANLRAKGEAVFIEIGTEPVLRNISGMDRKEGLVELLAPQYGFDIMALVIDLYNEGLMINWKDWYSGEKRFRVEAPAHPFETTRCWFEEPFEEPSIDILSWMHHMEWVPRSLATSTNRLKNKVLLLLLPEEHNFLPLINKLSANGNKCISVFLSDHYNQASDTVFYIDRADYENYVRVEKQLVKNRLAPDGVLHFGGADILSDDSLVSVNKSLQDTFYSLFYFSKAFHTRISKQGFLFTVITFNAYCISDADATASPFRSMCHVFLKALLAENKMLSVCSIDFSSSPANLTETADEILNEIQTEDHIRFAAYRHGCRYVQQLSPAGILMQKNSCGKVIEKDGVYLISGGAGGIGYEVAQALSRLGKCHLIILGRTQISPDEKEKFEKLEKLSAAGATFEYHAVDVADNSALAGVFKQIRLKHVRISGVFHAAGVGNAGVTLRKREDKDINTIFGPKVFGTIYLHELSAALQPSFFVNFSSIGAWVPAPNSADYSAANSFQDAFASAMNSSQCRHYSINWADWRDTGLSYRKSLREKEEVVDAREALIASIPTEEGIKGLFLIIGSDIVNVGVVHADLSTFRINPYFQIKEPDTSGENMTTTTVSLAPAPEQTASSTGSEARIASVWSKILKLDNVDHDADFYKMGGHSLNLAQLIVRIEKELSVKMEMKEMLKYNTVRKLAGRVDELQAAGVLSEFKEIPKLPSSKFYEINHIQKRFWMTQFAGDVYHVTGGYRIRGHLDRDALEKAFLEVIRRHESLRTTFHEIKGTLRQSIKPAGACSFNISYLDISLLPDPESAAGKIAREEASIPFDLSTGPLLRARLLLIGPDHHIFLMTLHHIISDGRSMWLLRNEVLDFYKQIRDRASIHKALLRIHYKDFAAWQNNALANGQMDGLQAYWKHRLEGLSYPPSLPVDFLNGNRSDTAAGSILLSLDKKKLQQLRVDGATLFTSIFTVLMILIHRFSGEKDILVGSPVSGRFHADLDDQIGNFLNTILLRASISDNNSYTTLLQNCIENMTRDFEHQAYPLDVLMNDLKWKGNTPFNIGFTWNIKEHNQEIEGTSLDISDFNTGFKKAKADLWFFGNEWQDCLTIEIMYRASLFRQDTICLLAQRFCQLIDQCILHPGRVVRELDWETLVEKEIRQNLYNFDLDF